MSLHLAKVLVTLSVIVLPIVNIFYLAKISLILKKLS